MTRAEILRQQRIQRQRQETGCRSNPITAYDNRAIVQRRCRIEDRDYQIVTEFGVQLYARIDDSLQTYIAFYNDQRSGLSRSQRRSSQNNLVVDAFTELSAMTPREWETKSISEVDKRPANFCLKQNYNRDANVKQGAAQNEFERRQTLVNREPIKQTEG